MRQEHYCRWQAKAQVGIASTAWAHRPLNPARVARDRLPGADAWHHAGMVLRPVTEHDAAELRRILSEPEVSRWWDEPGAEFPLRDDPESTRLVIEVDGAIAGMIQFHEEPEPKYRHASIDLFLDPAYHGRGLGTEACRRVVRHLINERGHHRITIDPAADNVAAIRAYEKVGFRPVGIMRRYERDANGRGWHDGLLMDLLAGEESR
ncbi:MAG TPA: GNAT family protein [Thermoleophilaceae bacterium]|nr:GNAT family protein [Thermoleophilaceae bacterium]